MRAPIHRLRLALWALLPVALVGVLRSDSMVFKWLPSGETHYQRKIGLMLQQEGMEAYWSMDEPRMNEQVHHGAQVSDGTRLISGVRGRAREFLPGAHGYIQTELPWNTLGSQFTVSCWLQFPAEAPDQDICQYLIIRDGNLTTAFPRQKQPLVWPLGIRNQFFHLAVTVDSSNGMGQLYINGVPKANVDMGPVALAGHRVCFGQGRWTPPAQFAIDEVSFWRRAMSAEEVQRLSRPGTYIPVKGTWIRRFKRMLCENTDNAVQSLLLVEDLLNPFLGPRQLTTCGLPDYSLMLSKRDIKAFNGYHNARVDAGLTGYGTSERRRISFLRDGVLRQAHMNVVGTRQSFAHGRPKPTYLVELEDAPNGAGRERWLFRPPEESPFLLQVLAGRLADQCHDPVIAPELCTISVNGAQQGVFLRERLAAGRSLPWIGTTNGWQQCLQRLPVFGDEVLRAFDELANRYERALRSDRKSPFTGHEMKRAIQQQRDELTALFPTPDSRTDEERVAKVRNYLTPELFLGENPMTEYIQRDLDFSVTNIDGTALEFQSLTPDVLNRQGHITSGPEDQPASVRVQVRRGASEDSKVLRYVIAGQKRHLPILDVKAAGAIAEMEPAFCQARWMEENGVTRDLPWGEIRLRGNTAIQKAKKKYYEIEFEKPHGMDGLVRSRRVLLTSAYRDPTLMRDKLAYDLFHSFAQPGKARYAPHARFVEMILNGDYIGVYEMTDRVDADLLEFEDDDGHPSPPAVLYKAVDGSATFERRNPGAYVQKIPPWKNTVYWGPYNEFMDFISLSDSTTFASRVEQMIDVENIMDFELFLDVTCNGEGRNYNLFIARRSSIDAKFFLVPWDYDMSFWGEIKANNYLIDRLHRDLPGYNERLKARWQQLRAGPLSEDRVISRVDEMYAQLAGGAADRNFRRWPNPDYPYEPYVEHLRAWLRKRLATMDWNMGGIDTH